MNKKVVEFIYAMLEEVVVIVVEVSLIKFEVSGQIQFSSSAYNASLLRVFLSTKVYVRLVLMFSINFFLDIQKKMVYIETDI